MSNINEFRKLGAVAQAYRDMLEAATPKKESMCEQCGESPCVCEQYEEIEIPEGVAKEDASDFVVAASKAKEAGKKEFEFGGKKYPVTIKTAVKTEEFETCDNCKTESKCMAEGKCMGKSESAENEDEKTLNTKQKGAVTINPDQKSEG